MLVIPPEKTTLKMTSLNKVKDFSRSLYKPPKIFWRSFLFLSYDEQTKGLERIADISHPCGLKTDPFGLVFQYPTTRPLLPNLNRDRH